MNLLVIAAWEPELQRFRALVDSIGNENLNVDAVGIGLVDATIGMTRCISQHHPDHVMLLGTCGAAPNSSLTIGDVVAATQVRLVDPTVVEGRAAMPYASEALVLDESMLDTLVRSGARPARVVNPLGITTDDALASKLAELGEAEHLEAYGVARACQAAGIACTVVLGIAFCQPLKKS